MARRGTTAKIDLRELEKLSALQATDEEVAAWFEVSVRTIERRRTNPKFAEIMARGKAKGRLSVRRLQMKMLENGNATMGVWLGKQLLGQTDQVDHRVDGLPSVIRAIILPKTWEVPQAPAVCALPAVVPQPSDDDRRRRQLEQDIAYRRALQREREEEKNGPPGNDGRD